MCEGRVARRVFSRNRPFRVNNLYDNLSGKIENRPPRSPNDPILHRFVTTCSQKDELLLQVQQGRASSHQPSRHASEGIEVVTPFQAQRDTFLREPELVNDCPDGLIKIIRVEGEAREEIVVERVVASADEQHVRGRLAAREQKGKGVVPQPLEVSRA